MYRQDKTPTRRKSAYVGGTSPFIKSIFTGFTVITSPWVDEGGGIYSIDGSQVSNTNLRTDAGEVMNGPYYRTQFRIIERTAGWARIVLGSNGQGTQRSAVGTFTETIQSTGGTFCYLQAGASFVGKVKMNWLLPE